MFSIARSVTEANMQVNAVDVSTEAAEEIIVVEEYRKSNDGTVQTEHAGDALP